MELTKKLITGSFTLEDGSDSLLRMKLIDVTTTNDLVSFGEVRLDNADGSLDGKFVKDADIKIELGLIADEGDQVRKIFTGIIEEVIDDTLLLLTLKGEGIKLFRQSFQSSLFLTDNNAVFREILKSSSLLFDLASLTRKALHSYVMNFAPVSEHLQRAIVSLESGFVPWVDREGKLILKTYDGNVKATDIAFELDELTKFENGIVDTILDTEIDIFNKIRVGGLDYVVTSHRFLLDEQRSKSFISLETT